MKTNLTVVFNALIKKKVPRSIIYLVFCLLLCTSTFLFYPVIVLLLSLLQDLINAQSKIDRCE